MRGERAWGRGALALSLVDDSPHWMVPSAALPPDIRYLTLHYHREERVSMEFRLFLSANALMFSDLGVASLREAGVLQDFAALRSRVRDDASHFLALPDARCALECVSRQPKMNDVHLGLPWKLELELACLTQRPTAKVMAPPGTPLLLRRVADLGGPNSASSQRSPLCPSHFSKL